MPQPVNRGRQACAKRKPPVLDRMVLHYNYPVHKSIALLLIAATMIAGCSWQTSALGGATPTLFVITSTLAPTAVPTITFTPVPPTPSPTVAPTAGLTSTQVNVRAEPSPKGTQLGILAPFARVQIVGRDAGGDWYLILYSAAPGGTAWATAQYISVQNKDSIPVVGAPPEVPTSAEATGTPAASGTIIQQVNVRKGPGTTFDAVGTLNSKDTAELIGKDPSGLWLQIRYAAGADGKGWIAAAYIQATGTDALPVIGETGAVSAVITPTSTPPDVTATPGIALQDNDSAQAPAANAAFSATGIGSLIYSSDLSAPGGDTQDFIAFTPFGSQVQVTLTCAGNGAIQTSVQSNGTPVAARIGISCGNTRVFNLAPGTPYLVELSIAAGKAAQAYVDYTIRIEDLG